MQTTHMTCTLCHKVNTELEEELHQTQELLKTRKQEAELLTTKATELRTKTTNIKRS